MCPIALLLIHALRHGLVLGSTIEQVLEYAANASDAKVVWLFSDRPLFAAFSNKSSSGCDLDNPAGNDQVLQAIKRMAIISNILCRVSVHGLRLGAAQDIAHLPSASDGSGFTTDQVRQSLVHSHSAFLAVLRRHMLAIPRASTIMTEQRDNLCLHGVQSSVKPLLSAS
ncbi:hypothetical protein V1504DRAFT_446817 [Lipomyces starkeyi]